LGGDPVNVKRGLAPVAACALIGCAPVAAPQPVPVRPPERFMDTAGAADVAGPALDPGNRAKVLGALPDVEKHFLTQFDKQNLPGLAVGVVLGGELVYGDGFGVRDMATKDAVDVDTVFRIASLTKSFTALAILKLRDQGRLSLDDAADRYVPELAAVAYPTRDSARITIRQLLTHSAGFPEDNPWGDRPLDVSEMAFARLVAKGLSFSSPPNTAFEYSNLGYTILGVIVSRASGVPYRAYVTREILRPLGMSATVFDEREVPRSRLALGYRRQDGRLVNEVNTPDGAYAAMGGLYSSVRDLARYAAFHLAAWPPRNDPEAGPVRRSSVREMHQLARPNRFVVGFEGSAAWGEAGGYGFGLWSFETCRFDHLVYHRGGLPGYGSALFLLPRQGVAIITLANSTYANPGTGQALRILGASGGLPEPEASPAPALIAARDAVGRLMSRWDDAGARSAFDPSFFLGQPLHRLRAMLDALRSAHGSCRARQRIDAENGLRGSWRVRCDRGWIDVRVTLAPTVPARIQSVEVEGSFPPDPRLVAAAGRAAALTEQWDGAAAAELFAPGLDPAALRKRFGDAASVRGACKLGAAERGDGKSGAVFALSCDLLPAKLEVTLDEASGKLRDARFLPLDPRQAKCAQ
jgi:CubicO group peptidase (beta-lactamase class C family)